MRIRVSVIIIFLVLLMTACEGNKAGINDELYSDGERIIKEFGVFWNEGDKTDRDSFHSLVEDFMKKYNNSEELTDEDNKFVELILEIHDAETFHNLYVITAELGADTYGEESDEYKETMEKVEKRAEEIEQLLLQVEKDYGIKAEQKKLFLSI